MTEEILSEFGFGIKTVRHTEDGKIEHRSRSMNTGIATEIIIQRMKMLLVQLERIPFCI